MALRDHSLDDGIIKAAYEEFLEHGFAKASLHKIAEKANVTTGAIYTRYKNKDDLFVSLLQSFFEVMNGCFASAAAEYEKARMSRRTEDFLKAIAFEEMIYNKLLFSHYDDCTLFFCRSDGSSVEEMLKQMMDNKASQTVEFFQQTTGCEVNADVIRLLMGAQFWNFRQLLNMRLSKEATIMCLHEIYAFSDAGWKAFFEKLQ